MVAFILGNDMEIKVLISDRNRQIAKWVRENLLQTSHYYDVWHIAKGVYQFCH